MQFITAIYMVMTQDITIGRERGSTLCTFFCCCCCFFCLCWGKENFPWLQGVWKLIVLLHCVCCRPTIGNVRTQCWLGAAALYGSLTLMCRNIDGVSAPQVTYADWSAAPVCRYAAALSQSVCKTQILVVYINVQYQSTAFGGLADFI